MVLFHSLVNVTILALLLVFAFQYQVPRNREAADARYTLASYLFGSNDHTHAYLHRRIETIDEFVDTLERTVRAYYAVPTRSRGLFMHYTDAGPGERGADGIAPPVLLLQYHLGYYGAPTYREVATDTYALTLANPLGPFADAAAQLHGSREACTPQTDPVAGGAFIPCRVSAVGDLLDRTTQLRLSFSVFARARHWAGGKPTTVSSSWDVGVDYGFEGHKAVVTREVQLSAVSRRHPEQGPLLICWAAAVLTMLDVCVRLASQVREATAAGRGRRRRREEAHESFSRLLSPTVGSVQVKENGWRWLGYLSNAVVLAFVAVALAAQHRPRTSDALEEAVTLLLAFAALLSSFRVVVLLKLFPAWYVLIDGLATALQQLSLLVVGVLPVLIGYAVCGTAVFGGMSGTYFESIPHAIVTLLCSMFGDNLLNTFLPMDQSSHWLLVLFARLFLVTFLALFVCNILNIAHSIIQDSYSQALKSYADLVANAAEAHAVAQHQQLHGTHDLHGRDSDGDGGDNEPQVGEPKSDSAASTMPTSTALSHPECSLNNTTTSNSAPRLLRRPVPSLGGLSAADVEQMLLRLERVAA